VNKTNFTRFSFHIVQAVFHSIYGRGDYREIYDNNKKIQNLHNSACSASAIKCNLHHSKAVHIINSAGIAYHQNGVLYIIIAKVYAPWMMRYNNGFAVVGDLQPEG
jgi:hypothetical protein